MPGFNGYLRRNRCGIYTYRRVLPEPVRACFGGRSEFIRSLATHDRRDAILLAQQLNLRVEAFIRLALGDSMPKNQIDYTVVVTTHPDGREERRCQRRRKFVPVRRSKSVPSVPPRRDSVGMRREGITGLGVR